MNTETTEQLVEFLDDYGSHLPVYFEDEETGERWHAEFDQYERSGEVYIRIVKGQPL